MSDLTSGRRARRATAVTSLLLALGAPAVQAGAGPTPKAVAEAFDYDGTRGGDAYLNISAQMKGGPALVGVVTVFRDAHNRIVSLYPDVIQFNTDRRLIVYTPSGAQPECPSPIVCSVSVDGSLHATYLAHLAPGNDTHLSLYTVAIGVRPVIDIAALRNYHPRRLAPPIAIDQAHSTAIGVGDAGAFAGLFTDSTVATRWASSLAVGIPPCTTAEHQTGAGIVQLTGGSATRTTACGLGLVSAWAAKPTTWSLQGVTTGVSSEPFRLLILAR